MTVILGRDRLSLPVQMMTPAVRPATREPFPVDGDQGRLDWRVVLVQREPNDAVAYRGSGTEEWVLAHGDKLSLPGAVAHFPNLENQLRELGLTYDGATLPAAPASESTG